MEICHQIRRKIKLFWTDKCICFVSKPVRLQSDHYHINFDMEAVAVEEGVLTVPCKVRRRAAAPRSLSTTVSSHK